MTHALTPRRAPKGEFFPEQLRRLREALNLDQKEAALRADVGAATWSRWESGAETPRTLEVIERVACALECSLVIHTSRSVTVITPL